MPYGIQIRGPRQYRAQVRRNGLYRSKTFDTLQEAQQWRRVTDGLLSGHQIVDNPKIRKTSLAQACDWMLEGSRVGRNASFKNVRSKLRYWKTTDLAARPIGSIYDWDLIEWRRDVLDEDNADDGETVGLNAECGAQTAIHRLNALSKLFQTWARAHRIPLDNPVKRGVRPPRPQGRDRRLGDNEEEWLIEASRGSSRPWLTAAIVISIETCVRQTEVATLKWRRVKLDTDLPYFDLPKTKNDRPRRVPLSVRAVKAFKWLIPDGETGDLQDRSVLPIETGRGIIHAFRDAISEQEFPDLRWHDLRHEAISRLFELTDLRDHEIMEITGHLTPAMLARYTHLRAHRLAARLPGGALNRRY
jgi:integrase